MYSMEQQLNLIWIITIVKILTEIIMNNYLKMEDHKQTKRVWVESPTFGIIYIMRFCPFLDLHKLERMHQIPELIPTTASIRLLQECTSKTMSWKRPSISLIQSKSLDFIWPCRLSIDISQEMLWRVLSNFRIGTLALGINFTLRHPPADQQCYEMKKEA